MQYFGGKVRVADKIAAILEGLRSPNQIYIEPFLGGASVLCKMQDSRIGMDASRFLIELYKALQGGWIPPSSISEEEYQYIKHAKDEELALGLKAFVGFGCSFAGKWFGGYARNSLGKNYANIAKTSLSKKLNYMKNVKFIHSDYRKLEVEDCLIYCDPPYEGFTGYGAVGTFNSEEFWMYMRRWSTNNTVVISEYNAPVDFECIAEFETKLSIRDKIGKNQDRVEKLFQYKQ